MTLFFKILIGIFAVQTMIYWGFPILNSSSLDGAIRKDVPTSCPGKSLSANIQRGLLNPIVMQTTTKEFSYRGETITFNQNHFVNATEMAAIFGKQPIHFLRLKQTKSFINAMQLTDKQLFNSSLDFELVDERNTADSQCLAFYTLGKGRNSNTWMHEKLALKFAAWLSPDFELWVFDRIQELLISGSVSLVGQHVYSDTPAQLLGKIERLEKKMDYMQTDIAVAVLSIRCAITSHGGMTGTRDPENYKLFRESYEFHMGRAMQRLGVA